MAFTGPSVFGTMAAFEVPKITTDNVQFANKFYEILVKNNPGANIFFSPLSAHTVLSMVYQGAAGTTAQNLASSLGVSDKLSTAKGYKSIMHMLNNIENVTLHVANSIFVMDSFPLKMAFKQAATDLFLSEVKSVNFGANKETASIINQWVENKTNSKIKNLIKAEDLNSDTRLVLVNAVYFKGNWANQFNIQNTRIKPFYVDKQTKVTCQMMHITKNYMYRENAYLDAQVLQIPYANKDVSMVVILPKSVDGIEALEKKLVNVDLSKLTEGMYSTKVQLSLPKFKMEAAMDLKSILTEMGMEEIFIAGKADFSEISDSSELLYVSKAVQKAFIEVNEEGSEAAAATVVVATCFGASRAPPVIPKFKADHPFIITLQSCANNVKVILFYGKVTNP